MSLGLILIIALYALLNIISFLAYGWDKRKARKGKWRTTEKTLLIFGLVGPWGAVAGMKYFHHKTQKSKFHLNYVFLLIHLAVIVLIVAGVIPFID